MSCLKPEIIYNKFLKQYVSVPCGHCEACCVSKQMDYANRVRNECEQHQYNVFITLTYDNYHIPFITPLDSFIHSLDGRFNDELQHNYVFDERPFENIVNADCFQSDGLAVLCYKDFQWFLKNIREKLYYHFIKEGYEKKQAREVAKVRYCVCGEYGPDTNRPHYHAIFHFHTFEASEYFRKIVPEVWTLCDWDALIKYWVMRGKPQKTNPMPSYCSAGAASNYVSKYVSNFVGHNVFDALDEFRPFFKTSRKPLYGVSTFDKDIYKQSFTEKPEVVKQVSFRDKSGIHTSDVLLSKRFLDSVFPKFDGFSTLNLYDTYSLLVASHASNIRNKFVRYKRLIENVYGKLGLLKFRENNYFGCFGFDVFCDYVSRMLNLELSLRCYLVKKKMQLYDNLDIVGYLLDNWDGFLDKSELYIKKVISNFLVTCGVSSEYFNLYYNVAISSDYSYHSYVYNSSLRQFINKHWKLLFGKKLSSHNQKYLCSV